MPPICGIILLAVFGLGLVLIVFLTNFVQFRARRLVRRWAEGEQLEVVRMKKRQWRFGPYGPWYLVGKRFVYYITVRDRAGFERRGYVRVASKFWSAWEDEVEVTWEGLDVRLQEQAWAEKDVLFGWRRQRPVLFMGACGTGLIVPGSIILMLLFDIFLTPTITSVGYRDHVVREGVHYYAVHQRAESDSDKKNRHEITAEQYDYYKLFKWSSIGVTLMMYAATLVTVGLFAYGIVTSKVRLQKKVVL